MDISPFNGDLFFAAELGRLVGTFGVDAIVETGSYQGHTTRAFGRLAPVVYSAEADLTNAATAKSTVEDLPHVHIILGSSEKVLRELTPKLKGTQVLYFLDAHWYEFWPVRDELKVIAQIQGPPPVIVIHDFQVPGCPGLGFDSYEGQDLNLAYVEDLLPAIYPQGYNVRYNDDATGALRGVAYITPV